MNIRRTQKGFTLIELLVVITILGIIAAILLPVFLGVRERARQTTCASNLHQIGLAIQMYQEDSGGILPTQFLDASALPADQRAGFDHLLPYERCPDIYHCADVIAFRAGHVRLDYRYRAADLLGVAASSNDAPQKMMRPESSSVLVYDMNHGGQYIVLRASGSVSQVASDKIVMWNYVNGKWQPHHDVWPDTSGALWEVFPDEPWPPQFEK